MPLSILPVLAALTLTLGCLMRNPDAAPSQSPEGMASLEAASVRIIAGPAPQALQVAVDALMDAGCRILFTDPASGIVTFSTSRRVDHVRDTTLEGTLRLRQVPEGLQLRLMLGGKTIWHGGDFERTETFSRCSEALHTEFLNVVAQRLGKP